ncbi:putative bifunctional diguanylate cyclase/phosphodiesterase [Belnapia moabensis]|uniref:putative bifunctional diguanylate cyclase/phosphodiesterase n=1 Tax=Belnapia moabensis TaxID=365533 RepID=UPI0005BADABA|nr:EAL domain-containing protein [Belnapia moabensis]
MGGKSRSLTLAVLGLSALLAAAAACASFLTVQRQDSLLDASRISVAWNVSQGVVEVARLQAAVGAFAVSGANEERDAVELWLSVVESRIKSLEGRDIAAFVKSDPKAAAVIARLRATIAAAWPLAEELERGGTVQRLLSLLWPLNSELTWLASTAYVRDSDLATRNLLDLARIHWTFSGLLVGLILCGFALTGMLTWNNRLLRRAHSEVQNLVNGLASSKDQAREAAAEAQLQNRILKERDKDLHTQYARFDAALNNMSQGLCMVDAEERLIVCNARFLELFELSPDLVQPGISATELFRIIGSGRGHDTQMINAIRLRQQSLASERCQATFFQEDKEGSAVAVAHRPMADGGWVATYEDITERRRFEARISFMAHHDALTGLPNRVMLRERMENALVETSDNGVTLLCLDLDLFKHVNDTLGHPIGDALLKAVAQRLRSCARETDLVARLGGDEFAILQTTDAQPWQTEALAKRIVAALTEPYDLGGLSVTIGVSVGIAVADAADLDADLLHKNADLALYRAKSDGRGAYRFFEAAMDAELKARVAIEADLRQALAREEFEVYYQPLIDLASERVSGFEALLRWRHPERGMVSPSLFIPVAEETGLIGPIGDWVLRRACADAAEWAEPIKVAVNLSPVQFRNGDIVRSICGALESSGLLPGRLELEITESTLLQEGERVMAMLHQLRGLGLCIALDDFGTGYSSLSYLRSFPFDKIKVDQSFVREMGTRPDCRAIVDSIAGLALRLGMRTTAEGIETADHLRHVREAGCTEAQGYYFSRPMPCAEVRDWLAIGAGAAMAA